MSAAARVAAPPVASSRRRVPRAGAADPAGRRPTPVASLIMRRRLAPRLHVAARASNGASSSSSSSTDDVASGYDDARPSIRDLEELLATAIRDEDFTAAASLRDRLSAMKRDAATGVLDANERFYVAFRSGSLRAMRDVWGAGDHVQCMHPGSAVISGAPDVLASWEIVFSSIPGGGLGAFYTLVPIRPRSRGERRS
ncbi:uncharacterized protein MICPUCDRAFT_53752 [Micromonas pusilla CCMP1545]|jgi:hypothetical protein|uniref:Predicted protein n=1 Tax=Micromonas pusilla (strain CCMP1545) TaxID=564608 RepID=C1N7M1_MICPC|nr:uncharacterized protein MICPUCDRAFT_53752 [Micromonas pusilla CCMP1545]EEH51743.1 predicted protein [Micromonas pusilla CCMP1545]|eukprot:XP_003064121.1 predicted protein [Micromonas pusilla CCMP1545]